MLQELITAIFKAGIPVALASYVVVWWVLKKHYFDSVLSLDDLKAEVKKRKKEKARESRIGGDPVHNKWLAFGGGFYGLMGLLTYMVVELGEIRDFFLQFESIGALLSAISLGMVIDLIIDAVTNFVVAIAWPVYWMGDIAGEYIWIWIGVAYGGYWTGAGLAIQHRAARVNDGDAD